MRLRELCCLIALLATLQAASVADADTWRPATTQKYTSMDGVWRLTVEPRRLESPLAYFRDEVDGEARPGGVAGDAQASAVGTLERCVDGRCRRAWRRDLRNDVAPVEAVVTNGGRVMTLDNWHRVGFGTQAVVLYDTTGTPIADYALIDILPKGYVMALPHSVSSMFWRGKPRVLADGERIAIPLVVPSMAAEDEDEEDTQYVDLVFDMATGHIARPPAAQWAPALREANLALAKRRQEAAEAHARILAPLTAPVAEEDREWHGYLIDAFYRLDPAWEDTHPTTRVLGTRSSDDDARSVRLLRESLRGAEGDNGVLMLAARSQDSLVALLEEEAQAMTSTSLKGPRIYLALDDAHFARVKPLLTSRGATLIQLDPGKPITQREETRARAEQMSRVYGEDTDVLFAWPEPPARP